MYKILFALLFFTQYLAAEESIYYDKKYLYRKVINDAGQVAAMAFFYDQNVQNSTYVCSSVIIDRDNLVCPQKHLPIYTEKEDPSCGIATQIMGAGTNCPVENYQECRDPSHGIESVSAIKTKHSKTNTGEHGGEESCREQLNRIKDNWNSHLSDGTYWDFDTFDFWYEDMRTGVVGNILVQRIHYCEVDFKLYQPTYYSKRTEACGAETYSRCNLVSTQYKKCRRKEFGLEGYKSTDALNCGFRLYKSKDNPNNEDFSNYTNHYCSSCDQLKVIDEDSAVSKYSCIVVTSSAFSDVQRANANLRKQIAQDYMKDISFKNFEDLFTTISYESLATSQNLAIWAFLSDFNSKYMQYLVRVITERFGIVKFNSETPFFEREGADVQIVTFLSERTDDKYIPSWEEILKLRNYFQQTAWPELRQLIFDEFYLRMYLRYIFHLEESEFNARVMENKFMSQSRLSNLEFESFKKDLENLNLAEDVKSKLSHGFSLAIGNPNNPIISTLLANTIEILHKNVQVAKSDFTNEVKKIYSKNKISKYLETYLHLLNLNGDALLRVVQDCINSGSLDVGSLFKAQLAHNLANLLNKKISALGSFLNSITEMKQADQTITFDNVLKTLNPYNADAFIFAITDQSLKSAGSPELISQVIATLNEQVLKPFVNSAQNGRALLNDNYVKPYGNQK